jgi:DNA-binding transcriptional LysR family regulator
MDKLANMQAFAAVAQAGSFAAAARRLNLANSVVSKRVQDLEDYLGVTLLMRTTRRVSLTDCGYNYLEHTRRLLDEMAEIESAVRTESQRPVGTIRLTAPLSFGMQYLGPLLADYLAQYPDVTIRTALSDRRVDLAEEGFDLALRVGALTDSSLIARKLCAARRVVCAAPAYFKKHGRPQRPADLAGHNCLSYTNLAEGKSWPFIERGKKIWQPVGGNFLSDNGDLLLQAALAGSGVTLLPAFIAGQALREKRLAVALENYEENDFDIYAVYRHTKYLSPKIRTLVDHFAAGLKQSFTL